MPNVLYIIEIAVALGLIIFVHELGHFLAAKRFGVRVPRFAIGFGPPILRWKRGGTEYSLRCIPLGGFVELTGEHPEADDADDPRAMWRRPAWQRAIIFSAGVAMNVGLAVLFFSLAPVIGMEVPTNRIAGVVEGSPAAKAGLQRGDRVVGINGRQVDSFEDLIELVVLADPGSSFTIVAERPGEAGANPQRLAFENVKSVQPSGVSTPLIGVVPTMLPVIGKIVPRSPEDQAGLKGGDRILSVAGQPVSLWEEINPIFESLPEGPVTICIERDGQEQNLHIVPSELKEFRYGFGPPAMIADVVPDMPAAKADIHAGDRVARIKDTPWPTVQELPDIVAKAGAGASIQLVLWREGKQIEVTVQSRAGESGRPQIGVLVSVATSEPVQIGHVESGGAAEKTGLRGGDVVLAAGPKVAEVTTWEALATILAEAQGNPIALRIKRGSSALTKTLTPETVPLERFSLEQSMSRSPVYVPVPRITNPVKAIRRGLTRTGRTVAKVYRLIERLVTGRITTKVILGPVGIVRYSLEVIAPRGVGTFLNFLAMLCVFLSVMNFLPVPPLDGGHVLFLVIEKIKGGPVGMKVRNAIWAVGWVAVLLLIAFIMWQDIARLIRMPF